MTKSKKSKKALFSSLLAMMLCFAMLVGTTFAWFTDSVTAGSNRIIAGNLSIDLLIKTKGDADYVSVKTDSTKAAFDYDLWEPGYTEVANAKVKNTGNLALKYTMRIVANGQVSALADVIDVYYASSEVAVADRTLTGLTRLGTLAEVLGNAQYNIDDNLLAGEEDFATIALHMQETAGNEYQGLSIGTNFAFQILATQYTYEADSFDNQYDALAEYEEIPTAVVTTITPGGIDVTGMGGANVANDIELDKAYEFATTEPAADPDYADYHADFVIIANDDIPADALLVAGQYDTFGAGWYGQILPAMADGEEIRLLKDGMNGVSITYDELCRLVKTFDCGAKDMTGALAGKSVTVELRLYKTDTALGAISSFDSETGYYIVAGSFTYTFA